MLKAISAAKRKNDSIDAGTLSDLLRCYLIPECYMAPAEIRGRTTAPSGTVLGDENTGEVVEAGSDVEHIKVGDLVSVPFNIACGRCRNCKEGYTNLCQNTNPATLIEWKRDGELSWQLYNAQGAVESVPSAGKGAAGVTDQHGNFILFE
jgi:hypothetical protein